MKKYKLIDLFSGVGGISQALIGITLIKNRELLLR